MQRPFHFWNSHAAVSELKQPPGSRSDLKIQLGLLESSRNDSFSRRGNMCKVPGGGSEINLGHWYILYIYIYIYMCIGPYMYILYYIIYIYIYIYIYIVYRFRIICGMVHVPIYYKNIHISAICIQVRPLRCEVPWEWNWDTGIIFGKYSDTRIKPLPLTNGHGRYIKLL
jgi:hypothetical protein